MESAVHKNFRAALILFLLFILPCAGYGLSLSNSEILGIQSSLKGKPAGDRIAAIAEKFIGTPYDPDPLGEYVTRAVITADERVDCMYLVFRSVELALSATPEEALQVALDKRFHARGVLRDGRIVNYENRFAYGEDMIDSGKWGREITREIGRTVKIRDPRRGGLVDMLPPGEVLRGIGRLRSGDIIFLIKAPGRDAGDEIVGHMGIIITEGKTREPADAGEDMKQGTRKADRLSGADVFVVHASGRKGKGGIVKKTLLRDYLRKMPFIGAKITRIS